MSENSSKQTYVLHAEPGSYKIKGVEARGCLAADYTGRTIDVEDGYVAAVNWFELHQSKDAGDVSFINRFLDSLKCVPIISKDRAFFRGRWTLDNPSSDSFGPPPEDRARKGRYNDAGRPVLYLCSSLDGVRLELETPPSIENARLWAQKFVIPCQNLEIGDFTGSTLDPFLASVMWKAESWREKDHENWRYRYSLTIANLVSQWFGGMVVPGVRGSEGNRYNNMVIFTPEARWINWLANDSPIKLE